MSNNTAEKYTVKSTAQCQADPSCFASRRNNENDLETQNKNKTRNSFEVISQYVDANIPFFCPPPENNETRN